MKGLRGSHLAYPVCCCAHMLGSHLHACGRLLPQQAALRRVASLVVPNSITSTRYTDPLTVGMWCKQVVEARRHVARHQAKIMSGELSANQDIAPITNVVFMVSLPAEALSCMTYMHADC